MIGNVLQRLLLMQLRPKTIQMQLYIIVFLIILLHFRIHPLPLYR